MAVLFPQTIKPNIPLILTGDPGSEDGFVVTGGTNGSKVTSINVKSTETINDIRVILLLANTTGILIELAEVTLVPGQNVNMFDPDIFKSVDTDGSYIIGPGIQLGIKIVGSITPGSAIHCVSSVQDY